MPIYRVRNRSGRWECTGKYNFFGTTYFRSYPQGKREECTDRADGWGHDNPFTLRAFTRNPLYLDGVASAYKSWDMCPVQWCTIEAPTARGPFSLPNFGDLALEVAARTNPSLPAISLPTMAGEARDIPGMVKEVPHLIKGAGDLFHSIPKANLAYRFGWKPFISDLFSFLDVAEAVRKRLAWLKELQTERVLKRRLLLGKESHFEETPNCTIHSEGCILKATRMTHYTCYEWATTRWRLRDVYSLPTTDEGMLVLAKRLAIGLTGSEAVRTAWELMPWSWLIDWFLRIGKFLDANTNELGLDLVSSCYMRTCKSNAYYAVTQGPPTGVSLVGNLWQEEVCKERFPLILTLLPTLPTIPALDAGQLSILGSLITLRGQGRR